MGKKKETAATDIVVTPSRLKNGPIKVQGTFKGIRHKFIITASPEAWIALKNKCFGSPDTYQYITNGLFKDIFPFINNAASEARGLNNRNTGHKYFLNVIRALSFMIYTHYSNKFKKNPIFKKESEPIRLTREIILQSHLGEWCIHHEIVHFSNEKYNLKSFYNDYIQKGKQIIKANKKYGKEYLWPIASILSPRVQKQSTHDKKIISILETSPF